MSITEVSRPLALTSTVSYDDLCSGCDGCVVSRLRAGGWGACDGERGASDRGVHVRLDGDDGVFVMRNGTPGFGRSYLIGA